MEGRYCGWQRLLSESGFSGLWDFQDCDVTDNNSAPLEKTWTKNANFVSMSKWSFSGVCPFNR